VLAFLEANQAPLRSAGYDHTVLPDSQINVYNSVGAAVEVIWSRRRADDTEIQRGATHFEWPGPNGNGGWWGCRARTRRPPRWPRPRPTGGPQRSPPLAEKEYPLGIVGLGRSGRPVAAAIANAVHTTGRRIHDLPITLDQLL
jgi:hypothetical protein